jgi:hypothetical protein
VPAGSDNPPSVRQCGQTAGSRNVRKAAARGKDLIAATEKAYAELAGDEKDGDRWQQMFVRLLAAGIGDGNGKKPASKESGALCPAGAAMGIIGVTGQPGDCGPYRAARRLAPRRPDAAPHAA